MQTQCLNIDRMMGEFHVPADTAFCFHRNLFEQKVAVGFFISIVFVVVVVPIFSLYKSLID